MKSGICTKKSLISLKTGYIDYKIYWPLSKDPPQCFILSYSTVNRDSFNKILNRWIPAFNDIYKHIPIVLVGAETEYKEYCEEFVSTEEGELLSFLAQASVFLECRNKCNLANKMVVETAIKAILQ